jgi:hypothetical protein
VIGFIERFDTAYDYNLQFIITHKKHSVYSHVFTSRCLVAAQMADVLLPLGSRTVAMPQLLASNSNGSQQLSPSSYLTHSLTNQLN